MNIINEDNLTIILPTFNEADNPGFFSLLDDLESLPERLAADNSEPIHPILNIIIVDDGSDNLEEKLSYDKQLGVTYLRGKGGESESIEHAILHTKTEYVAIMDADGSHPTTFIESLLFKENFKPTIYVGSRYTKLGGTKQGILNRTFSKLGNFISKRIFKIPTTDVTGRLLAGPTEAFKKYDVWYGRGDAGIAFLYHAQNSYEITDIPITYLLRESGTGSTDSFKKLLKFSAMYLLRLISLRMYGLLPFTDRFIQRGLDGNETGAESKITYKAIFINLCTLIPYHILRLGLKITPFAGAIATSYPQSILGYIIRNAYYRNKMGSFGKDILIDKNVSIWNPNTVYLNDGCIIDSNCSIKSGSKHNPTDIISCGRFVSIHGNSIINAKGGIILEDEVCIGANSAIFASSNDYQKTQYNEHPSYSYATRMINQSIRYGTIKVGKKTFIGTNSVVIGSTIGKNSVIGANSLIYFRELPDEIILKNKSQETLKTR